MYTSMSRMTGEKALRLVASGNGVRRLSPGPSYRPEADPISVILKKKQGDVCERISPFLTAFVMSKYLIKKTLYLSNGFY